MPDFRSQIKTNRIPVKDFVPDSLAVAPASPVNGLTYYDTALGKLRTYEAGVWVNLSADTNTTYLTGTKALIDTGTETVAKVWTAKDLKDGIVANSPVQSVAGRTGAVVLTKADVGLGNVDNTSDANKPVSTATQTALNGKANTSHTHTASQITDFNASVDGRLTGYATQVYVDSAVQGLDVKDSVRAASTSNLPLSLTAPQVDYLIDGITCSYGSRVLLKNQTLARQNGIYIVSPGGGFATLVRAPDMNSGSEAKGAFTFVEFGNVNANTGWVSAILDPGSIDVDNINWTQFSGAGTVGAGNGLTQSGTTLNVGAGTAITVAADTVGVTPGGIGDTQLAVGAVNLAGTKVSGVLTADHGGTGYSSLAYALAEETYTSAVYKVMSALTAGTWVDYDGLTYDKLSGGWPISVTFTIAGEAVELDWKMTGADTGKLQIKSDMAIAASTLSCYVVFAHNGNQG